MVREDFNHLCQTIVVNARNAASFLKWDYQSKIWKKAILFVTNVAAKIPGDCLYSKEKDKKLYKKGMFL